MLVAAANITMWSAPWDIFGGYYSSKSLSVAAQDASPAGLAFSSDGTKVYVLGGATDTIYQYTLSTAWDISTGSYASKSLSVAAQDASPAGLAFSSDGTKVYVLGGATDTIYQYTLSTAWDISTGSYASKSLSVTAEDALPVGLAFSSDGTKVYVLGFATLRVSQYTLSTAWDISTGSYASKWFYVGDQGTSPSSVAFSSDGTKAYAITRSNDAIHQYNLSTAWDADTGSYASKSLSVAAQDANPYGLAFSSDGTKIYIVGSSNDTIYQYELI